MQKLRRLAQRKPADWGYLAIAAFELLCARTRLSLVPTQTILAALQERPPSAHEGSVERVDIERLAWAIGVAGGHVPWRSDCFVQVMAADHWLARNGLKGEFYLGVTKDEEGEFAAHAWLKWGERTVAGGRYDQFRTLIEPEKNPGPVQSKPSE